MYIPALVLQYNNDQYMNGGVAPGTIKLIPTPNSGGYVFSDYWAVPVTGGIIGGYEFVPCTPGATDKPDPQAVHAVRIDTTNQANTYWVLGTSTQYIAASSDAECCVSPSADMPTTIADIAPCQTLCDNSDGVAFGVFGLPSPDGGTYTANGVLNDDALPEVTAATAAALVTALNLNATWAAIGTWAKTSDNLTLTVTSASAAPSTPDVLCVLVTF